MTFQPKGSMCQNCFWKFKNCSNLPFSEMRVIERIPERQIFIVKCDQFEQEEESIGEQYARQELAKDMKNLYEAFTKS